MNIMLACCAGMSTSLVVSKMEEAAKAQGKDDYKIWAVEQLRWRQGPQAGGGPGRQGIRAQ